MRIEPRQQKPVSDELHRPLQRRGRDLQLGISPAEDLDPRLFRRPKRLPEHLLVPADQQDMRESFPHQDLPDLRTVTSPEPLQPRPLADIFQEPVRIPLQKGHIPLKLHPKPRLRLPLRRLPMSVENFEAEATGLCLT